MICGLALLASGQAFAAANTCLSIASTGWNTAATWDSTTHTCGTAGVPTSTDDVTIAHTVTVDINAAANRLTVNSGATLNFAVNATPFTLTVGAKGIGNAGTFDATNAGTITSAATTAGWQGLYNQPGATFTMGAGTLTISSVGALTVENRGTLNGGSGLISVGSFRNGLTSGGNNGILTVGTGGLSVTEVGNSFHPEKGTITLNGNLTLAGNILAGTTTFSGAGKMILTDAIHTIVGSVNVHNLETAAFTGAHTLTLSGTVTATGITKLNGSAAGAITFSGGTFTPATTAYYCASAATTTGVTCNASAPPPPSVSASINLMSNEKPVIFAEEIEMK